MKTCCRYFFLFLMAGLILMLGGERVAVSAPIEYKETLTRILRESQVNNWKPTYSRYISQITVSDGGSKIGFLVRLEPFSAMDTHIYAMNTTGTGLVDLTSGLPSALNKDNLTRNGLTSLRLNANGTRLFFRWPVFGTVCDLYMSDTSSGACGKAVGKTILDRDFNHPYFLTQQGNRLFFRHNDPVSYECNTAGIYFCNAGATSPILWMGLNELQPYYDCNLGRLVFLGASEDGGKGLFVWAPVNCPSPDPKWSCKRILYVRTSGQAPVRLDVARDSVWNPYGNCNRFISAAGDKALYLFQDSGKPAELHVINLATKVKTLLVKATIPLNMDSMDLSASGKYARFNSVWWGKWQGYKFTRFNLVAGSKRDTLSHLIPESYSAVVSGFTADDRYYYFASKDANVALSMKVHRVDMAPTDFSNVPNISNIKFTSSTQNNITSITVTAKVTHAGGRDKIQWVKLHPLVEGLEWPIWINYKPFYYDELLYDDGTHGDKIANDGIYTNITLQPRTTSNYYSQYKFPEKLSIRIVARDKNDHYCLADAPLVFEGQGATTVVPLLLLD